VTPRAYAEPLDALLAEAKALGVDVVWTRGGGGWWEIRAGGHLLEIGKTPAKLLQRFHAAVEGAPASAGGVKSW
jgi:hypothetical protein